MKDRRGGGQGGPHARWRVLAGETFWVAGGQFAALAAMVAGVKWFTALLTPTEYGTYALAMSLVGAIGMLLFQPLTQAAVRFYPEATAAGALRGLQTQVAALAAGLTLILSLLLLAWVAVPAAGYTWGAGPALPVVGVLLLAILSGLSTLRAGWYNAARKRRHVALLMAGEVWLRVTMGGLAILLLAADAHTLVLGSAVGVGLLLLATTRPRHLTERSSRQPAPPVGALIGYAWPFSAAAMFTAMGLYADRWVLSATLNAADVGHYFVLIQIAAGAIGVVGGIVNQLFAPVLYHIASNGPAGLAAADRLLTVTAFGMTLLWSLLVFSLHLFAEPIVAALTSPAYAARAGHLGTVAAGLALFHLAQLLALRSQIYKRPVRNLWPKAAHGVASVVVIGGLGGAFGFDGVCIGLLVSAGIYLVAVCLANRRLRAPVEHAHRARTCRPGPA